ncbi:2-amino-4-hydroxy-6-hydroxymethyldihydropteridine diphosphokinase [Thiomicrorhabdus arctica]|uniref:2-amino-4-hydroxy-6- hydroxymethyldihydropteridine diphosphokinase n=1 Tax=Thiomicrorhabdus arctica TaxID=131540 RepID=UPI0003773CED|nr:2-amino-4-hydroxy-6-hydroxymethyldihydropteridine diphosphokinase [Thiomicrorhabdus arctica]
MASVYLGLGSNLENPFFQLQSAVAQIEALPDTTLVGCSQFYGSKPLGPNDQPDFINAVCHVETQLSPQALLSALQKIEIEQGRIKKRHWGERLIDLDILLYADEIIRTADLTIPHAEIALRDFVLIPLAEISPGQTIPGLGCVETLISNLETSYLKPLD